MIKHLILGGMLFWINWFAYGAAKPGEWSTNFSEAEALSKSENIPLIVILGAEDCHYCQTLKSVLNGSAVKPWLAEKKFAMAKFEAKYSTGVRNEYPEVAKWLKEKGGASSGLPQVGVAWPNGKGGFDATSFLGRGGDKNDKGITAAEFKNKLDGALAPYYELMKGVSFLVGDTIGNRLEAQVGITTNVNVYLTRNSATKAETISFKATKAGAALVNRQVSFAVNVKTAIVTVPVTKGAKGEQIELTLVNSQGKTTATSHITFVERENSPKNPTWRGVSKFGEWTMDRTAAMKLAADYEANHVGEKAYRLVLVGGSMWCPDCAKTDRWLVDTLEFKNWAVARHVACISVDIPNWSSSASTGPCLLTREVKEVSDVYIEADPEHGPQQSGAGYLSRWMISDEEAARQLEANQGLIAVNTLNGGWNRPERSNQYRTGVPIFILLNADGSIAGRFETFASTSPTEFKKEYLDRLDDLLATAGGSEANMHWKTTDSTIAPGGEAKDVLSAVDASHYLKLTGRTKWVKAKWKIVGASGDESEENAALNLWSVTDNIAKKVATAKGNLKRGFELSNCEIPAEDGTDYFVQVEALTSSKSFVLEKKGSTLITYTLTSTATEDAGKIAFAEMARIVKEDEAKKAGGVLKVYAPLARTGGATGNKNVTITIDAASTAAKDRYALKTTAVAWKDGEMGSKSVEIDVFDDANADGTEKVILRAGDSTYTLSIVDNDRVAPGKLAIDTTSPVLAKAKTMIATEGSEVEIGVSRLNGASGDVSAQLKATGGVWTSSPLLTWNSREGGTRSCKLKLPLLAELPRNTITVSLTDLQGGATADFSTKTLTIQLISKKAPYFEESEKVFAMTRYTAMKDCVIQILGLQGNSPSVRKISGVIPTGVKVKVENAALVITGVPSRADEFTAVYQVSERIGRTTVPGQTIALKFGVVDVSTLDPADPRANPFVKTTKKIADMIVVDQTERRLAGLLTGLSIPANGRVSAKYKCAAGMISFSARNWTECAADGTLSAELTSMKKGYKLAVTVPRDGRVRVALTDPDFADDELSATAPTVLTNADGWKGSYTLACHAAEKTGGSMIDPLATGDVIATLRMTGASAIKKAQMTYAGILPNGQSFSGSAMLLENGVDAAILPIYYRSTKEFFTGAAQIKRGRPAKAISEVSDLILPYWEHNEKAKSYEVKYPIVWGSAYDSGEELTADKPEHILVSEQSLAPLAVTITPTKVALASGQENPARATLRFTKSTGMVYGSFRTIDSKGNSVTANYKGVLLQDWGDGCPSCDEVPWMTGSFWFTDRGVSTKCGEVIYIEAATEKE